MNNHIDDDNTDTSIPTGYSHTLHLRYDYTNLERMSLLAKQYETMQTNCSLKKIGLFHFNNDAGLGSNLHVFSIGLCVALQMQNVRMRTHGPWVYKDVEACGGNIRQRSKTLSWIDESPIQCYFPQAESICSGDFNKNDATTPTELFDMNAIFSPSVNNNITLIDKNACPDIIDGPFGAISNIRAATTEYLFTRVSNIVQQEAERQLQILFGTNNASGCNVTTTFKGKVPKNLITVHMRWGDKASEMELVPTLQYIEAIYDILDHRKNKTLALTTPNADVSSDDGNVHIYLCTEDPLAVKHFMLLKPKHWNVYLDQYYEASLPNRKKLGNINNPHVVAAEKLQGRTGLIALGSLLVAMEANDFVLTTASNWSRLINEIRKNIINPRCNDCTKMIDLSYGEF